MNDATLIIVNRMLGHCTAAAVQEEFLNAYPAIVALAGGGGSLNLTSRRQCLLVAGIPCTIDKHAAVPCKEPASACQWQKCTGVYISLQVAASVNHPPRGATVPVATA